MSNKWDIPHSRLGFGCYALGGAYGDRVDYSRGEKIIHLAYDLGIRYFDTADQYGTEELLGKAVKPFRREVSIATKVGADSQGKMTLNRTHIVASCEASLKKLDTDYLDLYQVHYDDPGIPVSEVVDTLELLKTQGKIRQYGVGHLPVDRTRQYLELGNPLTVLAEMNSAALNRYRELRPLQERHNFGIIAFSITGRGLLTGKISEHTQFTPNDLRSLDPFFKRNKLAAGLKLKDKLAEIGANYSASPAQMAIAWVLSQPGVDTALTGPNDPAHLRENCRAMHISLEPADLENINEFIHRENQALQVQTLQEIRGIVDGPVNPDPAKAAEDLLYVLEHGIEEELIPYEAGVDLFMKLLELRKFPQGPGGIRSCQEKIRSLLQLD